MSVTVFTPGGRSLATQGVQVHTDGLRGLSRRLLPSKRPQALLAADDGTKLALPFAPVESSLDGSAGRWDEIDRAGRTPLVRYKGGSLPTLGFDVVLGSLDGTDVEGALDALTALAKGTARITIAGLSRREEGPWRLVGCAVKVTERTSDNAIAQATASLTFKAASDVTIAAAPTLPTNTGPLTGGVKTAPKVAPVAGSRTYTVKTGDSLWTIAKAFYGNPEKWPAIAAANSKIRKPSLIYPGQVLTIPAG